MINKSSEKINHVKAGHSFGLDLPLYEIIYSYKSLVLS